MELNIINTYKTDVRIYLVLPDEWAAASLCMISECSPETKILIIIIM